MKSAFHGYYPPNAKDLAELWNGGTVVFDTNVLLNLYRYPDEARNDFFAVLEQLRGRLWIPHHVALEFQTNRIGVIADGRSDVEDALTRTHEMVATVRGNIEQLHLDKRGLDIDARRLLKELEDASDAITEAVRKAQGAQLDISSEDSIRSRLDALLDGYVGDAPASQEQLDELYADGSQRYSERIPPGFKDANKSKDPKEATLVFDNLRYPREYGDLILWRQLLQKAKEFKAILFITSDRKEDWWWRQGGKTIGPHPSLLREMQRHAPDTKFWMYTSDSFLQHARGYLGVKVTDKSVDEVKQVASQQTENVEMGYEAWRQAQNSIFVWDSSRRESLADSLTRHSYQSFGSQLQPSAPNTYTGVQSLAAIDIIEAWVSNFGYSAERIGPQSIRFNAEGQEWVLHVVGGTTMADLRQMRNEFYRLRIADTLLSPRRSRPKVGYVFALYRRSDDYTPALSDLFNHLENEDPANRPNRLLGGRIVDGVFIPDIDRRWE